MPNHSLQHLAHALTGLHGEGHRDEALSSSLGHICQLLGGCVASVDEVARDNRASRVLALVGQEPSDAALALYPRYALENPVLHYYQQGGVGDVLSINDFISQAAFRETALYREVYGTFGGHYQISTLEAFPDGVRLGYVVFRDRPFRARDYEVLRLVGMHLRQAIRRWSAVGLALPQPAASVQFLVDHQGSPLQPWARLGFPQVRWVGEMLGLWRDWPTEAKAWAARQFQRWKADPPLPPQDWEVPHQRMRQPWLVLSWSPVASGGLVRISPAITPAPGKDKLALTRREWEVLRWIAEGKRDAEICRLLGISLRTVGKHVQNVLAKTGTENRTAAARWWFEQAHSLPQWDDPKNT